MSNKNLKETDVLEWNAKHETRLFVAMMGRKPVGVNRHFMMVLIHDKFSKLLNKQISSDVIWKHLDTLYDMAALHESEIIPFPNDEVEFELPEEFDELATERCGIALPHSEKPSDSKTTTVKYGKKSTYSYKGKQTPASVNSSKVSDVNTSKSSVNSQTPVTVKTNKSSVSSKSEPKEENESMSTKVKVESPAVGKNIKNKRSSILNSELKIKHDANLSPQVKVQQTPESQVKKVIKVEISASSKKGSKDASKSDHGENVKKSKESSGILKKTKLVSSTENSGSRRNSKVDTPATKKKSDEAVTEKTSDIKSLKVDSKKGESEADSSSSIGSSKVSRAPSKGGSGDTPKKRKRVKTEEPASLKKASPAPKRRR